MIRLKRITVYPIKSLDGVELARANVLPSGALENDRRFALMGDEERFVNGKRVAGVHRVRAEYDLSSLEVALSLPDENAQRFSLEQDRQAVANYLGAALDKNCRLIEDNDRGFPDDTDAPGPTVISTRSLETIAGWFELPVDECRRRFRTTLEIDAPHAFWEDQFVGKEFSLGSIRFRGAGVCQRCVVPTRNPTTGEAVAGFQKRFAQLRDQSLPDSSPRSAFNHFYRAALNTRLAGAPGVLSVGDQLTHSA